MLIHRASVPLFGARVGLKLVLVFWGISYCLSSCTPHKQNSTTMDINTLLEGINSQSTELVVKVLRSGVNPNFHRKTGYTSQAAKGPYHPRDTDGMTPLMIASGWSTSSIVQALLKAGADINAEDTEGKTALMWACMAEKEENVALLWKYHPDIERLDKSGHNALSYAAGHPGINKIFGSTRLAH